MTPLPCFLRRNGFNYDCINSGDKAFIYRQRYDKIGEIEINYYEVFKKVVAPDMTLGGTFIPSHISFPGNEAFGTWAWSFRSYDKALLKFKSLEYAE
jgi:hypothetical protein